MDVNMHAACLTWLGPALLLTAILLQQTTDRQQHLLHLPKRLPQAAAAAARTCNLS